MWQGSTYKKNSLNLQKIEAIEISLKIERDIFSHNFARKGLQKAFICSKLWSKVMFRFSSISDIDIYIG